MWSDGSLNGCLDRHVHVNGHVAGTVTADLHDNLTAVAEHACRALVPRRDRERCLPWLAAGLSAQRADFLAFQVLLNKPQ